MAVNSFVFLARNGWFDDVTFHRVIRASSPRLATRALPALVAPAMPSITRPRLADLR
jgi:hypothetical protein